MATTFVEYTGDGNATKQFTFPSLQESDVKVRVDGVLKTTSTHYNITSYTTTGGGNVVFTSGNIPSSPANIRIYRDTNVDEAKATFTAGSSVKAADLNNNTTQLLYRAQEEQIPNLIHSYDVDDNAIIRSKIIADAVDGTKIADDSINSEHYVDGSIDTAHIADSQITSAKIANDTIVNADVNTSAAIAGTKITPAFGSQNLSTSGTAATGALTVTGNIAVSGTVDGRDVAADGTKLDGIEAGATADQTASDIRSLVESATDSNVFTDADHSKLNAIEDSATADQTAAEIRTLVESASDSNVFTDADHTKLNAIESNATQDQTASEIKTLLQSDKLTASEIANNAITTDKIADSELTTLAGMQSGTASKLADSTALTADIADLNQIDGMAKQTTITDDDTKFPTSGAIVDYVAAQLEPFGGFEAIANESSFPNTQPASGVVISIADAGGMAVSSSGTASGATVGGTTVNITGIASNFNGTTITTGVRFLVVSTGSGQNYTYHKATLREDDLASLSGDINDFSERYRVGSTNPTTSLDNGDLFFNTGTGKLLVYNGTNAAWEETQTVGNFFINTISSSSGTGGGSATPNGTAYRFTLSNAGTVAQQHLVSIDGVIQKPNSGTSQPSEGFAIDSADIIFGSAPVSGASIFVITIGASVSIGTPSNDTVTTAILQNGSVTTAKIVNSNITTAKIADDAVTQAKIADDAVGADQLASSAVVTASIVDAQVTTAKIADNAVTAAKIPDLDITTAKIANGAVTTAKIADGAVTAAKLAGSITSSLLSDNSVTTAKIADDAVTAAKLANTSVSAGSYGSSTSIPSITVDAQGRITAASGNTVNTDLVGDTSPQLGGALDTNGNQILVGDGGPGNTDENICIGDGKDLKIYHDGSNSVLYDNGAGDFKLYSNGGAIKLLKDTDENMVIANTDGAVDLYYNNVKKLETTSSGIYVSGDANLGGGTLFTNDNGKVRLGSGQDLELYHSGSAGTLDNKTGDLRIKTTGSADDIILTSNDDIELQVAGGEAGIKVIGDGAVELYHNQSKKLETTSGGATITGTCTATAFAGDGSNLTGISAFVSGMIILWSGAENAIPSGWVLCNGSNSTPDLRDRFVVGAGNSYSVGNTGGSSSVTLTVNQIPAHGHTIPRASGTETNFDNTGLRGGPGYYTNTAYWLTSYNTGGGQSHENRPPYYALCYIMKT